MTERQLKIDSYECQRDVAFAEAGGKLRFGMFDRCMESKGYKLVR